MITTDDYINFGIHQSLKDVYYMLYNELIKHTSEELIWHELLSTMSVIYDARMIYLEYFHSHFKLDILDALELEYNS